ncbi:DUF1778 domain-containing protein [Agromyces sp. NPDC058484]|uniref:type II toxin-antitoxin system TacA family antitoxin n=1 Tax=Agromyces sp. NPDC058484 TaxID=3346524 RepID=UPI003652A987
MATPLKDKRIELRLTSAQKDAIETAAAIEGRSITDFSMDALTAKADEVIRRDRELRVEAAAFDEFAALLDQPANSVDGLRELLTRKPIFID